MPVFSDILSLLPDSQKTLIVELSASRLAAVMLRPSKIWTYAVVKQPIQRMTWAQDWQQQAASLSETNREYLKLIGRTPQREGDVTPYLSEFIAQRIKSVLNVVPDFILPVGSLSHMKRLGEILEVSFPTAEIAEAREALTLPDKLGVPNLRAMIAQASPPSVDRAYYLKLVKLNETSVGLEWHDVPILQEGEAPPTLNPPAPKEVKLCTAVQVSTQSPPPTTLMVHDHNESIIARQVVPPKPIFHLQCWFNYRDDKLRIKVVDPPDNKFVHSEEVSSDEATALMSLSLPSVQMHQPLDVVFIVDGTMRRLINTPGGIDGEPDIEAARDFVCNLLQQLAQDSAMQARGALCLYGDDKDRTGADYEIRTWPFESARDLEWHVLNQATDVKATPDLDYEAMLEKALDWANTQLPWRYEARKVVVVIGYAPPHPPQGKRYPAHYGFKHDPFTSKLDWERELVSLENKGIQRIGVWVPYPATPNGLDHQHPCLQYSRYVWHKIGGRQTYEGLQSSTEAQVMQALRVDLKKQYITAGPIPMPFEGSEAGLVLNQIRQPDFQA